MALYKWNGSKAPGANDAQLYVPNVGSVMHKVEKGQVVDIAPATYTALNPYHNLVSDAGPATSVAADLHTTGTW